VRRSVVAAWLLLAPLAVSAHHGGLYDEQRVVAIQGEITAVRWINPHVHLTVAATAADGRITSWQVEATSINALERWGVERDWFAVGERVSVTGAPSRFDPNAMAGVIVVLADGRQVVLWPTLAGRMKLAEIGPGQLLPPRAAGAAAASVTRGTRGIFKVWSPRGRLNAIANLPLTERAREAARAYEPLEDDPALRCIPAGMPVMLDTPYPVEFVEDGDRIVMRLEEWDGRRTIYMNPRNGPAVQEHSPYGVSFGRWEGETLAIFTTYIDYPYADDLGTPQSKDVTVLERYTPSADATRLGWSVTVTDPATFTEPIVRRGYMAFEPGETIKPYDCTLIAPP
jgi:Family of unknown function (DUF6152)